MNEKSNSNHDAIHIEVKENENDNDSEIQFIDPLIEPTVPDDIDEHDDTELPPTIVQRFTGIIYTLLGACILTLSIFVTKQLNVDIFYALIPRFVVHIVILIIYITVIKHYTLYKGKTKQEILLLLINIVFVTTGTIAFFVAYRYLPLSDLTTIRYTQVVWTSILFSVLHREKPTIPIILGVLLTTIGAIFVAQPTFLFRKTSQITKQKSSIDQQQHVLGLLLTFYAAIALSIAIITNKYLLSKYKTKQSLIVLQLMIIFLLFSITYVSYKYYFSNDKIQSFKNDFLNWRYLCAALVCFPQILSSIFAQKAVKREHPAVYIICKSGDILFAILLQNIFSSVKSNLLSIFGSIFVLTSIMIISGSKLFSNKKKTVQTCNK